jgi:hypothetical protein
VPFARDLHPEFGYIGTGPRVFRRLRLVLSFVVLGIVGGASGVAVFMASPDSANPLDAMALAPAEALIETKLAFPAVQPAPRLANASGAEETDVGSTKPTCRESGGECIRVRVIRPSRAVDERPLIAAAPIGHRDDPTVVPALEGSSWPAAPPEKPSAIPAPTEMAAEATPADTTPAAEPTPLASKVTSKKLQPRAHHELRSGRHNNYSYRSSYSSRSSTNLQGGYARLW